jgi:hypothetical protein
MCLWQVKLHLDRVVDVAGEVPTRCVAGVRKKRVRAGNVFLRLYRINFIFHFVVFAGNSNDTSAVKGTCSGAKRRETQAQVVPGKIKDVSERHDGESTKEGAAEELGDG